VHRDSLWRHMLKHVSQETKIGYLAGPVKLTELANLAATKTSRLSNICQIFARSYSASSIAGTGPAMRRIVVAIDPAISVSETSDATGIVVVGLGDDGRGYLLEDLSGEFSPTEWATRAVAAYKRHEGDRIVAEANQGGAMVETTLRAVDRSIPVRLVHASRGKITRAEPVSALYEQNRVHHVGCFPELEDELCSFKPGSTDSPDRLDALVWGLTDLMLGGFQEMTSFHAPITGPGRSEWIAAAGFGHPGGALPISTADGMGASCDKPGGWPAGSPQAGGLDAQLGWSIKQRN
jgi:phage terminase large subunit-like protein